MKANHSNSTAFVLNTSLNVINSPLIFGKVKSIAVAPTDITTLGDLPYESLTLRTS